MGPRAEADEAARLSALRSYALLGAESDAALDAIVRAAARSAGTPMAFVSVVGEDRIWYLAGVGGSVGIEASRQGALSDETIRHTAPLVVEDTTLDPRVSGASLASDPARTRFYAGVALVNPEGFALGTLSVVDVVARTLSADALAVLQDLAVATEQILEHRRRDGRRDEAERARREAEKMEKERWRIFDELPAAIGYFDRDLVCRYLNRCNEEFFGWDWQANLGRHVRELLGDDGFAARRAQLDRVLAGEQTRFFTSRANRSGEQRHLDVTYLPLRRDGEVVGAVGLALDITAQRRAEAMLETERAFQELVLRNVPDGAVFLFGLEKRVIRAYGGDIFTRVGLTSKDYEGRLVADWAREENRDLITGAMETCLAGERADIALVRGGRTYHATYVPLRDADGVVRHGVVFSRDVTAAEAMREHLARQERLVTVGTLAAGVGHEINNPLTYVLANLASASALLGSLAGPAANVADLEELLVDSHDGAMRIRDIVRGLAEFSRPGDGATVLDPAKAVAAAVRLCGRDVRHRASLEVDLEPVPPVHGDEARLVQVLVNLLVNAAQAFELEDPARQHIVVRARTDDEGRAIVEVTDDGPGMSKAVVGRVFEPFFTTKSVGSGSGLGLWISHNIVTSMGGTIDCESVVGRGTAFTLAFPALPGETSPPASSGSPSADPGGKVRVLIVDDEPAIARILRRILREYEVVVLHDAREAKERLENESFDVVFCDILMPKMSGIELYDAVSPEHARRFVFMTGDSLRPDVRAFFERVPNDKLEKPFDAASLRAAVARVLSA